MILKYISIPELNFSKSWETGIIKIKALSKFDRYMTIFWLLGPFIYLIERDPADLWLSTICLVFLFRCFKNKDWNWAFQFWFIGALALWLFGLFSAITSPDPFFSFQQGFVWMRFPLYAAAAQVWLAKDRDIRIVMLISMLAGMLIMCVILFAETLSDKIHGTMKMRLIWPYGDSVPGAYVAKFSLPLFCVLVAIAVGVKNKAGIFLGIIALLSILATALTGERMSIIIIACSGMLAGLIWKPKFYLYSFLIITEVAVILAIMFSQPLLMKRYGDKFAESIPIINTSNDNYYWGVWRSGVQQGLETPFKGIGPSGTRKTCINLDTNLPKWLPGKNWCANHPHNFYIQLFAETGIIGFFIGCFMFFSIIVTCYKERKNSPNCPMTTTAFIIPFALFFPLQQFGSFYGQWGNLFTWFALAFALSQVQKFNKDDKINKDS